MNEVTRIVTDIKNGNQAASGRLFPLVYDELRRLAAIKLRTEAPGQTLDATALVHEAYLRLVGSDPERAWDGRGHFFAAAAEAMRRILIDRARKRVRLRHGSGRTRVSIEVEDIAAKPLSDEVLLDLDAALARFTEEEPEKARLVRLRFFAGLTEEQAADVLNISRATASRHWKYARAWLLDAIQHGTPEGSQPDSEKSPSP